MDLHSILASHETGKKSSFKSSDRPNPTYCQIPDLFFDTILVQFKLSRIEIMVLMHLYRLVWCWPNLYKEYGFSQILSHSEMAKKMNIEMDELHSALHKLEKLKFIQTIRSGQYFVRKFFTEEYDKFFNHEYDNF